MALFVVSRTLFREVDVAAMQDADNLVREASGTLSLKCCCPGARDHALLSHLCARLGLQASLFRLRPAINLQPLEANANAFIAHISPDSAYNTIHQRLLCVWQPNNGH